MNAPSQDEHVYHDSDGNPCSLDAMCIREPAWAANRIRATQAALADMFAMLDEGLLERSTKNDAAPDWHARMLAFMKRLEAAYRQIYRPAPRQGSERNS